MRPRAILLAVLLSLFLSTALAETEIKAEVDKAKLSTDEALSYKLTVTSSANRLPVPTLPKFAGFYLISQAQSSSISFEQAGVKSSLVYTFILAPQNSGKFKIEPTKITTEGKTYSSAEFEIEVTEGKAKPKSPPVNPQETPPESDEPQVTL